MKKGFVAAAAAVVAIGLLAGCGGSSTTASTKVSGKVADGYLEQATVFLDKNGNYRLDAGEPNAVTDANGAYTLSIDPADLGNYPIVALAVRNVTIDQDTGLPVTHSYLLSLPKESVSGAVSSNFISPISTQVREMMETGNYTMTEAMEQLRLKLHLAQDTDMMADYVAGQNQLLHNTAQNMATLMGGQMGQVYQAGSDTLVDVNRYRGMMGAMFGNISSVRAASSDADRDQLMTLMSSSLNSITIGQPFRNMSSYFGGMGSGGMMGGGGMMGR